MTINWKPKAPKKRNIPSLVKLEYQFRLRATKFLLEKLKDYEDEEFEKISIDFDTETESFHISKNTPEPLYSTLLGMHDLL